MAVQNHMAHSLIDILCGCFIDCGAPSTIQGVVIPTGNTWLGSSRVIQCQTGYQPENNDVSSVAITCLETGDWSEIPTTFNCLIGEYVICHIDIKLMKVKVRKKTKIRN